MIEKQPSGTPGENILGRVHSFESLGALDGPGLRFVVFLQGCPLRCVYCHNPDTWAFAGGQEMTARQVADKALRYRPYWAQGGGVTVGGGEPLAQAPFVAELFRLLRAEGVHTALDTSGMAAPALARPVLENTRLVIADMKFTTAGDYQKYCGGSLQTLLDFLALTAEMRVPLWLRQVVVPGLNDDEAQILRLAEMAKGYPNLEKLELLAFRKLAVPKYQNMGIPFPLENTPEMDPEGLKTLQKLADEALRP